MPADSPIPESEQLLPGPERYELVEYLLGIATSELDEIRRVVEKATAATDMKDYIAAMEAGVELSDTGGLIEESALLDLLLFATGVLGEADQIRTDAAAIQREALLELQERRSPDRDKGTWAAYADRIREYHASKVRDA